jgi:hypothetical protein
VTQPDALKVIPNRRIKAADGMAITADVWEEAHDFHRRHQRLHARLAHGAGILAGLEVVASDPADTTIYIRPGLALDPQGDVIILAEPLTYDVGASAEGSLYVLLTFGESRPRAGNGHAAEGAPAFVQQGYGLEAVSSLPAGPHVELARFRRQGRGAALRDASDPAAPRANEIDQRFRRSVRAISPAALCLALVHLGGADGGQHLRGAQALARAVSYWNSRPVWVDDNVPAGPNLAPYSLVYLVAHGGFTLNADQMNGLYAYLKAGGTVLAESDRRDASAAAAADQALADLLGSLGLRPQPFPAGHALLQNPALFMAPPAGFEPGQAGAPLQIAEGVVLSTAGYGCVWAGERRPGPATREEIRAAHELGANLLAFAEARREKEG